MECPCQLYVIYYLTALCRNVTICTLVQVSLSEKVVAEVPVVIFLSTAHFTGSAYHALTGTSIKLPTVSAFGVDAIAFTPGIVKVSSGMETSTFLPRDDEALQALPETEFPFA